MTTVSDTQSLKMLLRKCVHCGLCLPTCPTYDVLGDERDSPRGRLFQMKALMDGVVPADDPSLNRHLSRCLDCRACETACPSGVRYGQILEETRAALPPSTAATAGRTIVLGGVFGHPGRLAAAGMALRAYQRTGAGRVFRRIGGFSLLPPRFGALEAMLPPFQGPVARKPLPVLTAARGTRRAKVGLLTGCVMGQFFAGTNAATTRVLAANGCEVVTPRGQGCCGALHAHAGAREQARARARALIDCFDSSLDAIITNAAGCGSMLKEYGHLLRDDPAYAERAQAFASRVKDIGEFLAELPLRPPDGRVDARVTYQDACHLRHAQRVWRQPRAVLAAIPGLDLVELEGSADCCGSAGIYNVTQFDISMRLLDQKMDRIAATGARIVAVGNPGCAIQIKYGARSRGLRIEVAHPVDLLDRAYRGERSGTH
ncbi:MAG: uncharacterized protein JWO42_27 [Chloroflexi bacterium]|jgi:glycolate oxidase iron-sulfur subunit|nr:uncharacterized protein [Chloroflexota bacterium]